MKRSLFIFIAFVLPLLSLGSEHANSTFIKGNNNYNKAQYKEALDNYRAVLNSGYQSAALYFNMGNASYKLGEIPSAILYFEKAHKLSPGDQDINFNIKLANAKTTDKIDPAPVFFLTRWWHNFILSFSTQTFAIISITMVLLASGLFIVYLLTNILALKKFSFYISLICVFAGLFSFFIANRQVAYFNDSQQAIIFNGTVNVKSGPTDRQRTLFIIHEGTKVNILEKTNGWINISMVNGNQGWIKLADTREI